MHNASQILEQSRFGWISDDANDKFQILQQTPVSRILSSAKQLSPKSSVSNGAKPKLTLNLTASGKSANLQTGAKFC